MILVFVLLDIPVWTKAYAFVGVAKPFEHALSCAAILIIICVGLDLIKRRLAGPRQGRTTSHVKPTVKRRDSRSCGFLHGNVEAGGDTSTAGGDKKVD